MGSQNWQDIIICALDHSLNKDNNPLTYKYLHFLTKGCLTRQLKNLCSKNSAVLHLSDTFDFHVPYSMALVFQVLSTIFLWLPSQWATSYLHHGKFFISKRRLQYAPKTKERGHDFLSCKQVTNFVTFYLQRTEMKNKETKTKQYAIHMSHISFKNDFSANITLNPTSFPMYKFGLEFWMTIKEWEKVGVGEVKIIFNSNYCMDKPQCSVQLHFLLVQK